MITKFFKSTAYLLIALLAIECVLQIRDYIKNHNRPGYRNIFSKKLEPAEVFSEVEFDPYLFYRRKAMLSPPRLNTWYTDQHGFLCFDKSEQNRNLFLKGNKKRIFIFGASTPEGINNELNIGALLQKYLSRSDYEVIMATGPAQGSMQELLTLQTKVLYMHPDILITFDGSVDAMQSSTVRNYQRNDHSYAVELKMKIDGDGAPKAEPNHFTLFLLDFIKPIKQLLIFKPIDIFYSQFNPPSQQMNEREELYFKHIFDLKNPTYRAEAVDSYIKNLESFNSIARENGIKTIHVLQPTLAHEVLKKGDAAKQEEKFLMVKFAPAYMKLNPEPLILAVNGFFSEAARRFKAKNEKNWWNYLDAFPAENISLETQYIDHIHYQKPALEALAKRIAEDLKKKNFL